MPADQVDIQEQSPTVAVVGLGYVGLPLALEFGKRYRTIGYDRAEAKVASYLARRDPTGQVSREEFDASKRIEFTADPAALNQADYLVVAVPTPIDAARRPDFEPLVSASEVV